MPVITQGAGGGRDDIVGGVDFLQNELDCFVHEQFRVKAKAEVIKRFYFLKGMPRGGGKSGEKVEEVWGGPGRFLSWCFVESHDFGFVSINGQSGSLAPILDHIDHFLQLVWVGGAEG